MSVVQARWTPHLDVDGDTLRWLCEHMDECQLLERFTKLMATELAANDDKGNRPGWLTMTSKDAIAEVLYHAAKLAYAVRQFEQWGTSIESVREHAADVGNCALMTLDVVEQRAMAKLRSEAS